MVSYYLTCRSLTYAQRVSRALTTARIKNYIVRTPQSLSVEGCGYAVRTNVASLTQVLDTLNEARLPPKKVYSSMGNGQFEEVDW